MANGLAAAEHWPEVASEIGDSTDPVGIFRDAMDFADLMIEENRSKVKALARVAVKKRRVSPEQIAQIAQTDSADEKWTVK